MSDEALEVTRNRAKLTWDALTASFPDSCCTLDNEDPFRLCVRGILSAQCTDKRVNIVASDLFERYQTAEELCEASLDNICEIIKPCGLFRSKGRSIRAFAELYVNEWNKVIPEKVDELMKCPGVGRKIANLIIGEVYAIPAIVVDTHCKRTAYRIGLTSHSDPLRVEKDLDKLFPEDQWISIGHLLVDLGRSYCTSVNPDCENCPLNSFCKRRLS